MTFQGTFNNYDNSKTYWVKIGNTNPIRQIQDNDSTSQGNNIVCFAMDPITIDSDNSDTFQNVYIRSCTISLIANYNISRDVTAFNYTDIPVEIREVLDSSQPQNGTLIFKGYVEPLSFNQTYSEKWNGFELNCVDLLGIAEYLQFPKLLTDNGYNLSTLDYMSPRSIMNLILQGIGLSSITYSISNDQTENTLINPNIFIGETQDDWKNCNDVLNTIGKIYGCWFYQSGGICKVSNILRPDLSNPIALDKDDYTGSDANLSLSEAYNQIKLTCNIDTPNTTLIDPFDNKLLTSPYSEYYYYMNEVVVPGDGDHALSEFKSIIRDNNQLAVYEPAAVYKHFAQIYVNPLFNFRYPSYATQSSQLDAMNFINASGPTNGCRAGFIAFGKSENVINPKDTESIHQVDMKKYLVIGVNGHERNDNGATMENQLDIASPICTVSYPYVQNFTPNDVGTTNYFVISGKILLQSIIPKTGPEPDDWVDKNAKFYEKTFNTAQDCIDAWAGQRQGHIGTTYSLKHRTIPHPDNGHGAYYMQRFVTGDDDQTLSGPISNDALKRYQFKYSSYGTAVDDVDKISMIACRMKIGNKYCVERLDLGASGINVFEWIDENNLPTVTDSGTTYTLDFFTVGMNPKIDDYIIGQSIDIADTRDPSWNISTKGTCIPIKYTDRLHGNMTFEILGPYNIAFTDRQKVKHGWWFTSHTFIRSTDVDILEHVSSIFISDFKIDLVSNNGGVNNASTDNDLVYYSKQNVAYIESKEYDVDLCTALTTAEATSMGINYNLTNNAILRGDSGHEFEPFQGFTYIDKSGTSHTGTKLEEARVYEQYNLWKEPREIVDVSIFLSNPQDGVLDTNYQFSSNWQFTIAKNGQLVQPTFKCIGREIDLKYNTMKLTLKNMNGM